MPRACGLASISAPAVAAVYLLWMFQRVFMWPAISEKVKGLKEMNRMEMAIMLAFLVFIFWIGIAPSLYFRLMDSSVSALVADISNCLLYTSRCV